MGDQLVSRLRVGNLADKLKHIGHFVDAFATQTKVIQRDGPFTPKGRLSFGKTSSVLAVDSVRAIFNHPLTELLSELVTLTMHKRFLATTVLAAALLFSQGGNFLIGALCPHLRSGMSSCGTQLSAPAMSHDDMAHEHMGHMEMEQESAPRPSAEVPALGQQIKTCSHCAVHSRTNPNTASLRKAEASKRLVAVDIPLPVSRVGPFAASPVPVLTSRAHGPPGEPPPKYILINIFRI